MDDGEDGAAASELEKTSLKDAIAVFDRTFMKDLWVTIRYETCARRLQRLNVHYACLVSCGTHDVRICIRAGECVPFC